ncbi:MAG: aldo/keto reductase [Anaerolineae bacterium]|nr:aldo/keto reductase [Anaerolineae bacterium]
MLPYRPLDRTGLKVSVIGFGCGAVGGLLVKGDRREMIATVARAIELGINYFDTAAIYGDGASETNLGQVLAELKADVLVGTKVQLAATDDEDIAAAVVASVERSLRRLRRDRIDLIQLHNAVAARRQPERHWITVADVLRTMEIFARLGDAGKVRFWGINGLGETPALHQAVEQCAAHTIQCCYNLINPSAGVGMPASFPFQNYERLLDRAAARGMGVIAIRVLAAGALSGTAERHPNAATAVTPIASSRDYIADVAYARRFACLVEEGYVGSLTEAAIRFAIGKPEISTALIGISDMAQLEQAVRYAAAGPLPQPALDRIAGIWAIY